MSNLLMTIAAASAIVSYQCSLDAPTSLVRDGDKISLVAIGFPGTAAGSLSFKALLNGEGKGRRVSIEWVGDPFQIAGDHQVLATSDQSVAFAAAKNGGCMFTEQACLTTVHIVDAGDSAKVIIQPAALTLDVEKQTREPFTVIMEGRCARSEIRR